MRGDAAAIEYSVSVSNSILFTQDYFVSCGQGQNGGRMRGFCLHDDGVARAEAQREDGTVARGEAAQSGVEGLVEEVEMAEEGDGPRARRDPYYYVLLLAGDDEEAEEEKGGEGLVVI